MGNVLDTDHDDAKSVQELKQAADTFETEAASCEKTSVIGNRLERIRLWARYVVLRKEYYHRERQKDTQAIEKAGTELVRFVESNRSAIQPYQWVDILIPRAILERLKAVKEEPGMVIEKKDRKKR